ncbi:unnamed protein product, partial [Pelagomonas calceolata]
GGRVARDCLVHEVRRRSPGRRRRRWRRRRYCRRRRRRCSSGDRRRRWRRRSVRLVRFSSLLPAATVPLPLLLSGAAAGRRDVAGRRRRGPLPREPLAVRAVAPLAPHARRVVVVGQRAREEGLEVLGRRRRRPARRLGPLRALPRLAEPDGTVGVEEHADRRPALRPVAAQLRPRVRELAERRRPRRPWITTPGRRRPGRPAHGAGGPHGRRPLRVRRLRRPRSVPRRAPAPGRRLPRPLPRRLVSGRRRLPLLLLLLLGPLLLLLRLLCRPLLLRLRRLLLLLCRPLLLLGLHRRRGPGVHLRRREQRRRCIVGRGRGGGLGSVARRRRLPVLRLLLLLRCGVGVARMRGARCVVARGTVAARRRGAGGRLLLLRLLGRGVVGGPSGVDVLVRRRRRRRRRRCGCRLLQLLQRGGRGGARLLLCRGAWAQVWGQRRPAGTARAASSPRHYSRAAAVAAESRCCSRAPLLQPSAAVAACCGREFCGEATSALDASRWGNLQ